MPVVSVTNEDELFNALVQALSNAGISFSTDETWGTCSHAQYIIIDAQSSLYKPKIYFRISGMIVRVYACDNIVFYNVYDEETGEVIGRCVDTYGDYSLGYVRFSAGNKYINSTSEHIAVLSDTGRYVGYGYFTDEYGTVRDIIMVANIRITCSGCYAYATVYGTNINNEKITRAVLISGGKIYKIFDDEIYPPTGDEGYVYDIDGSKYVRVVPFLVPGDGTEGSLIATMQSVDVEVVDIVMLDLSCVVTDTEVAEVSFLELEGVGTLTYPSSYLDEEIAERIQEHPEDFPEIGQSVLDKSKRIITRLEFG